MDVTSWRRQTPQETYPTKLCVARALYDNIAESPDELIFRKGDLLTVLEQNTQGMEGWWLCSLKGRQGICPANRLRLVAGVYATALDIHGRRISESDFIPSSLLIESDRMSGVQWTNQVVLPHRIGDRYTYDVPRNLPEDYDVPKNRPVLPQQDTQIPAYDVPKTFVRLDTSCDSGDYDCPRGTPVSLGVKLGEPPKTCPTYDVPQSNVTYDVPQTHITVVDHIKRSSGLSVLSGSSSGSSLSAGDAFSSGSGSARSSIEQNPQDLYDIPVSDPKRIEVDPESSYDVPRNAVFNEDSVKTMDPNVVVYDVPQNERSNAHQEELTSRLSLLSLSSSNSGSSRDSRLSDQHSEGESGSQLLEKLRDDVCSCLNKVCAFVVPNWRARGSLENKLPDLKSSISRFRGSLKTFVDFSNGCLVTAMKSGDENLTTKLQKCFQPVLDSYSIINKNTDSLNTKEWVLESLVERGSSKTGDDLDQLVACSLNLSEDIHQLASLIKVNAPFLFRRSSACLSKLEDDLGNDYEYITLDPKADTDGPLTSDTKRSFEKLMKDSLMATDRIKFLKTPNASTLNPNDRQVLQFYSIQAETHVLYLNNAIDAFFTTIQNNQPPKVFIGHSKFLILSAHKLIYIGDTVYRNILNDGVRVKVLNGANKLCEGLKQAVQATKTAALQFPSVAAVQQMVDAVMTIAHLARDLKVAISNAAHS